MRVCKIYNSLDRGIGIDWELLPRGEEKVPFVHVHVDFALIYAGPATRGAFSTILNFDLRSNKYMCRVKVVDMDHPDLRVNR